MTAIPTIAFEMAQISWSLIKDKGTKAKSEINPTKITVKRIELEK